MNNVPGAFGIAARFIRLQILMVVPVRIQIVAGNSIHRTQPRPVRTQLRRRNLYAGRHDEQWCVEWKVDGRCIYLVWSHILSSI